MVKFNEYMLSIDIQFGHGGLLARPAPVLLDKFPASIEAAWRKWSCISYVQVICVRISWIRVLSKGANGHRGAA